MQNSDFCNGGGAPTTEATTTVATSTEATTTPSTNPALDLAYQTQCNDYCDNVRIPYDENVQSAYGATEQVLEISPGGGGTNIVMLKRGVRVNC